MTSALIHRIFTPLAGALLLGTLVSACQQVRNFTTYYNRYWNMERILAEVEDDVDYYRDQEEASQPRYVVPFDEVGGEFYSVYLEKRTLTPDEVRKHKIKLDSILLKGSILLTHQGESDYVDDAIYLMATSYFYQREWFQSASQAVQVIENFPDSKWQPDAHLLLAMGLLKQGELEAAEEMLSKTVDIAFRFKRQDILTDAFRLNADVQLAQGETNMAVRPYERAILLSESGEEKARWQYELGLVHFRAGDFAAAVEEFDKVEEFDPEPITSFEAGLQAAVALRAAGEKEEAERRLDLLAEDDDLEAWRGIVAVERLNLQSDDEPTTSIDATLMAELDSLGAKEYLVYGYYERGVRAFRAGNYDVALVNLGRVQSTKSSLSTKSRDYTVWINFYKQEQQKAFQATYIDRVPFPDSLALEASRAYYNIARFFTRYEVADSAERYYRLSAKWGVSGSREGARATFALSEFLTRKGEGVEADSLMERLAEDYGDNEWAREARRRLGYTEDIVIDRARDTYLSGLSLMQNAADYPGALARFRTVYFDHAGTAYAPQALYATGLIYERYLEQPDSALFYYARLLNSYPESEQATAIRGLVETTMAGDSTIDTTDGGLVSLADADGDPSELTDTTEVTDTEVIPWYDSRLFDRIPALALQRREARTRDEEPELE